MMHSVTCIAFCKCENIKYSGKSLHSIITRKMYKQISSVHGSSVLNVKQMRQSTKVCYYLCNS